MKQEILYTFLVDYQKSGYVVTKDAEPVDFSGSGSNSVPAPLRKIREKRLRLQKKSLQKASSLASIK